MLCARDGIAHTDIHPTHTSVCYMRGTPSFIMYSGYVWQRFKRQTREQAAKLRNFAEVLSEGNLIQPTDRPTDRPTSDTGKCSRRQREGLKTGKVTPHVKQVRGGWAGREGQGKWGPQQCVHPKQCHDTTLRCGWQISHKSFSHWTQKNADSKRIRPRFKCERRWFSSEVSRKV